MHDKATKRMELFSDLTSGSSPGTEANDWMARERLRINMGFSRADYSNKCRGAPVMVRPEEGRWRLVACTPWTLLPNLSPPMLSA